MAGCFLTYLARGLHGVYQVRFLNGVIPNLVFTADCYVHIILKKFVKNILTIVVKILVLPHMANCLSL